MGLRDQMRKMKEDIVKRTQESIERTKETAKWRSVFFEDKLPQGVGFWRPTFGAHIIDLIPFIAGANHPRDEKGRLSYMVDYYLHRNIGPLGDNWVCKMRTFKIAEPICDYIKRNRPPKEEWKKIKPTRMTTYLVWVHDTPEEEKKGIQIWDVAHFLFQEPVDAQAKHPKGGAPIAFADIDDGKSIFFEIVKSGKWTDASGKERDASKYQGHKFIDREAPLPDEIVDASFSLDEYMDMNPSDELVNASFYGEAAKQEEGSQHEEGGGPPETPEEFRREPVVQAPAPSPPIPPPAPPPSPPKEGFRSLIPGTPPWRTYWAEHPFEQEDMLEYKAQLAKQPPHIPTASPTPAQPPPAPAAAASGQCPAGGTYGADNEKLPECRKCHVWDACAAFMDSGQTAVPQTPPPAAAAASTGLRRRR